MPTRRVITGRDDSGHSIFIYDGSTPGDLDLASIQLHEIWVDDPSRRDRVAAWDPALDATFNLEPPTGGSMLRLVTFQPDSSPTPVSAETIVANAARFNTGDAMEADNPGMHTTKTIDYGVVLSGEIVLQLDDSERTLGPGDVVVQRGTRHAWRNRSAEPCVIAFVMVASPNYS